MSTYNDARAYTLFASFLIVFLGYLFRRYVWQPFTEGSDIRYSDGLFALLVHGLLFGFLIVGVQCSHTMQPPGAIQGVIISSQHPPKPAEQTQVPPTPPQPVVPPKAEKSAVAQEETHQNAAEEAAKKRQEAEAAQRAVLEQQRAQEKAQAEAIAQQKAKAEAETKAKAQEEAKKAAEVAAARKQAEEEKQKQALAAQKKADADKRAKAAAAKAAADKKWAQEQLQGELASELLGQSQSQWISQLTAAISRAWSYIAGADQLHCKIKIQLSGSGEVLSARVTQSSGNKLFDDSAVTAAYKASPLPLPSDPSAFDPNLTICFSPGGTSC